VNRFVKEYGEQPLGKFVRNIIGIDVEVTNPIILQIFFISKEI
jgi:type I restriction enzyme R subunit